MIEPGELEIKKRISPMYLSSGSVSEESVDRRIAISMLERMLRPAMEALPIAAWSLIEPRAAMTLPFTFITMYFQGGERVHVIYTYMPAKGF